MKHLLNGVAIAAAARGTRRDELSTLGLARAAPFTWDETARRHEDVYRAAVAVQSDR